MKFAVAIILAVALCHTQAAPSVSYSLESAFRAKGTVDIMISMKSSTNQVINSINSKKFANSVQKTTVMVADLKAFTAQSQKEVLSILNKMKSSGVQSFWITNRISVSGATWDIVEALKGRSDIEEIREAKVIHLEETVVSEEISPRALEWGVNKINGPGAWAAGFEGLGIVVSSIDTGVRPTHECLRDNLRSDYAWFDPYMGTDVPNDQNGHGTHTMGTIAGTGGTGVAPKSKWIACKGCSTSDCTEAALLGCGQWTTCPTLADGTGEDCSKKPNLSSNSWGGGQEDPWFDGVISAWQAANIVPVFALGNSGPLCRSASSPGDRAHVISAGATNFQDEVTSFSSHGPTLSGGSIKPEVSAPGNNVRSASHNSDTGYAVLSGTSMACPHVAGAVAVLLSKNPAATFDDLTKALYSSAFRPEISEIVCGGGGVNQTYPWPNNSYGHGRIDVNAATQALF